MIAFSFQHLIKLLANLSNMHSFHNFLGLKTIGNRIKIIFIKFGYDELSTFFAYHYYINNIISVKSGWAMWFLIFGWVFGNKPYDLVYYLLSIAYKMNGSLNLKSLSVHMFAFVCIHCNHGRVIDTHCWCSLDFIYTHPNQYLWTFIRNGLWAMDLLMRKVQC